MAAARSDWIPTPLALGEQCPDEIVIADGQVFWIAGNSPYGQVKTLR
jgi:hypothetical protein